MSILSAIPIIGTFLEKAFGVIDKAVTDKDLAMRLKTDLQQSAMTFDMAALQEQAKVLLGEIQGESSLQRNWRPLLMLSIVAIVVNNYILYPYLSLFGAPAMVLELPDKLWILMEIGVGGYIVGRSAEKIADTMKK